MEEYINKIIDAGMGIVVDLSVDKVIHNDTVYQMWENKSREEYKRLIKDMSEERKEILENYIDYLMNANERSCNIAYLTGVRDTIEFIREVRPSNDGVSF